MEFWIFMIVFIFIGGGCSLTGTWWSKKKKEEKKKNKINKKYLIIKNICIKNRKLSVLLCYNKFNKLQVIKEIKNVYYKNNRKNWRY